VLVQIIPSEEQKPVPVRAQVILQPEPHQHGQQRVKAPARGIENEDVCEQLRRRIKESGKTHYRVARDAGIKPEMVARFVRGERDITGATFAKLCKALGLELRPKAD
jgi:hypothetical protein